jgi:hypothetical protein
MADEMQASMIVADASDDVVSVYAIGSYRAMQPMLHREDRWSQIY